MSEDSSIIGSEASSKPNKSNNHIDNPTLQITTEKLNGNFFLEWSLSAKLFLRSKKKMGYILGTVKIPKNSDPLYESWDSENSMIMSWLLNSMQSEIGRPYLFLSTAKDIWDTVVKTYSKKGNVIRI